MKTVSRNKFLHCFRPVADTDSILDPQNRSTDLGFSYANVENKQHVKPLSSESVFLERGCSMNSENSVNLQPPKRSFLGIIKAVIFDTFLAKRVRDREGYRQLSGRSNCKFSKDLEKPFHLGSEKILNLTSIDSKNQENLTNLAFTHSSSIPKSTPEPKGYFENLSKPMKQSIENEQVYFPEETNMGCNINIKSGFYLFLICLAVTVLWGKLFGMVFTLIWLYFVRYWHDDNGRQKEVTERPKTESKDYKKVIMEGLLERKHHRSIKNLT